MTFLALALVGLAALLGPLLALPGRWGLPVVVGELLAGVLLGPTGVHLLGSGDPTFTFLAEVGFALVMFVAGSHVPVADRVLVRSVPLGLARAGTVAVAAVPLAVLVAHWSGTGHGALYAVLIASSSAALVLPVVGELKLSGPAVTRLLPQVAVADTACILALPLALDPARALRVGAGSVAVLACAAAAFVVLRELDRRGWRRRLHRLSHRRTFALELRLNLVVLFGLAAVAVAAGVSVLLAGFALGLVVAAIGEPRRLARQLFALTEGFLGPVFFVWLGSSLDLRALAERPSLVLLGLALGVAAVLAHLTTAALGQPLSLAALGAAQLGVPVAAATLGTRQHVLAAGEPAALLLGALVTVAVAAGAGAVARGRFSRPVAPDGPGRTPPLPP